ncbi:MAG TPA: phosphopantetheine-binding protein [Acidobacteriaceae bacterium]
MAVDETKREFEVLAIFRQLLGVPQLGPEQNFFESGGSSLLAARLAARLRTSGILDVPTSAIFAAPTARALACYAETRGSQQSDTDRSVARRSPAADRGARQRAAFARLRPAPSPHEEVR